MESTIELSVLKKEIHFVKKDSLTTGQQRNSIKISFNGKEWNGLTKYGVFKVEDTVKDVLITNSDIEIPAEVCTIDNLGKVVYFGIKGTYTETIDGTKTETVYTTPYFRLGVLERGTETSGNIPEYPTQNVIDAAIENARRWAVGPSSIDKVPSDENNAKYWSEQAKKFANIFSEAGQLVVKDKYTTLEKLRDANPNHAYTYQVEQPNSEFYIYSDIASDWVSIGALGSYTAGTGIEIIDGVISATAEVYKAGDGISITNSSISARLGSGLKFDTEKKITLDESAFVEYTDDEITNFYNAVTV